MTNFISRMRGIPLLLATIVKIVTAIHSDEAGLNDFLLQSMGHGAITWGRYHPSSGDNFLSTGDDSCHVGGRSVATGELLWRKRVCSSKEGNGDGGVDGASSWTLDMSASGMLYTLEDIGETSVAKGWDGSNGDLLFNVPISFAGTATAGGSVHAGLSNDELIAVISSDHKQFQLLDAITGTVIPLVGAASAGVHTMSDLKLTAGMELKSFHNAPMKEQIENKAKLVALAVKAKEHSSTDRLVMQVSLLQFSVSEDKTSVTLAQTNPIKTPVPLLYSSLMYSISQPPPAAVRADVPHTLVFARALVGMDSTRFSIHAFPLLCPHLSKQSFTVSDMFITDFSALDDTQFEVRGKGGYAHLGLANHGFDMSSLQPPSDDGEESAQVHVTAAGCNNGAISKLYHTESSSKKTMLVVQVVTPQGTTVQSSKDISSMVDSKIMSLHPHCGASTESVLLTTEAGTTLQLDLTGENANVTWKQEEHLGSINDLLILDRTHHSLSAAQTLDAALPDFTSRLSLQVSAISSFISQSVQHLIGEGDDTNAASQRDIQFGFSKLAVALSSKGHAVYGLDVSSGSQNRVLWTLALPKSDKHALVHSTATTLHHANNDEVLIVNDGRWMCLNANSGTVLSRGLLPPREGLVQMVPFRPTSDAAAVSEGGCHQHAVLLYEDGSVNTLPSDATVEKSLQKIIHAANNGYYLHALDKHKGLLTSTEVTSTSTSTSTTRSTGNLGFSTQEVGQLQFSPQERVVSIHYPNPDEIVQTPVTILGDDSLLLKYLNPHLAVVVTELTDEARKEYEQENDSENGFVSLLSKNTDTMTVQTTEQNTNDNSQKQKRKPMGATKPGEDIPPTTEPSIPTLFINVIDTVSAKLLYRISHTNVAPLGDTTKIPVSISENWILYSYPNHKTRRSDVVALTLHEGMIDKHGITAFSRLDQETTFSSFTSPKPIVLHKVYTIGKTVTALGVTQTARGITQKNFVFGLGGSGMIVTVDRRMLDPRRPTGEPKATEKLEGLMKYHPLIPIIPSNIPSYHQNVESSTQIVSTAAYIESQSMVLAYGGPDIFFVRLAPSKSFDLLPESFNKGLLSVVVFALIGIWMYVNHLGKQKAIRIHWS